MSPVIRFLPADKTVQVRAGTTIFQAARIARVVIRSRCGGKAACMMCKVRLESDAGLAPMNDKERRKLGTLYDEGYRLSCQAAILDDVTVTIPDNPLKAAVMAQLLKQREENE